MHGLNISSYAEGEKWGQLHILELTRAWISQLSASNSCIKRTPKVITHCPPHVEETYFYASPVRRGSTNQPDVTMAAGSCINAHIQSKLWQQALLATCMLILILGSVFEHNNFMFNSCRMDRYTRLISVLWCRYINRRKDSILFMKFWPEQ